MKETIKALQDMGVRIPDNLEGPALLRLAKQLNPWTVTVSPGEHAPWEATTRPGNAGWTYEGDTPEAAALSLLLAQLQAGKYTVADTGYKQSAQERAAYVNSLTQ